MNVLMTSVLPTIKSGLLSHKPKITYSESIETGVSEDRAVIGWFEK